MHREKGQGRFKAFSLGESVAWDLKSWRPTLHNLRAEIQPEEFRGVRTVATSSQGRTVAIRDVIKDFEIWVANGFADRVRDIFALQLYDDPSFGSSMMVSPWTPARRSPR